jgi:hypothetical protein
MVTLSQSDTSAGLKEAIEGRIRALANVHSLFVETRWIGAELSTIATQEPVQRDNYDGRLPTIKLAKSGSRRVARRELPV